MEKTTLSYPLSVPLDDAQKAAIHIDNGDGNMMIDSLACGEALLAGGLLEYLQRSPVPAPVLARENGQANLNIKGTGSQRWLRLPWKACNGATTWFVHLTREVAMNITALSGGGNLELDLSALMLTGLQVETGGGNITVVLPACTGILCVNLKSGAGNVNVSLPAGVNAKIQAATGLGKVIVDPAFAQVDKHCYQSPDFDQSVNRVEITAGSGAGNVVVNTR